MKLQPLQMIVCVYKPAVFRKNKTKLEGSDISDIRCVVSMDTFLILC